MDIINNKVKYIKVAKENKEIVANGCYTNNKGDIVDLSDDLNKMIDNTTLTIKHPTYHNNEVINDFKISDNIIPLGTIDCIIKLRNEGIKGNIIALNFASATNPGGGYLRGVRTQEESLCRGSMLYPSITSKMDFYDFHNEDYTPLYSDMMIYSKDVPVIRNDNCDLLDKPVYASFITSPAVNRKVAKAKYFIKDSKITKTMDIRIQKILNLAMQNNPSVIILGNFGCGAFGNDIDTVYRLFEKHINTIVPKDVKVVFAIRKSM